MTQHWLKIVIGLLIGSLLVLVVITLAFLFCYVWEKERSWRNADTLAREFKSGTNNQNFLNRAKQMGADELSVDELQANCGEWESINTDDQFEQFNDKYKTLFEGRVSAIFKAGPFERDICNVTFKQGKVIKAEVRHLD